MGSVNTSHDMGLHEEQLAGRTQQRFFSASEEENYTYPWAYEVDFDKSAEFDAADMEITDININQGDELEAAMRTSIDIIDGVFTYLVATSNQLGMAKDVMSAKPMVLYESDEFVGLASEEVAIRSIFPREIDTWDPYQGEVKVWAA